MLNSGFISFILETGGGMDENGNPIPVSKVVSEFVNCNLQVMNQSYPFISQGQYLQAKYQIIVENNIVKSLEMNIAECKEVALKSNTGHTLGTFQIQSNLFLPLTLKWKIIV